MKYLCIPFYLIALIYSLFSGQDLYHYLRLNATATANQIHFSVEEINDEKYFLRGAYSFMAKGEEARGEASVTTPYFRNPEGARRQIPKFEEKKWTVYFSKNRPAISALEHDFPWKSIISAMVLWGVAIYFWYLSRVVN